MKRTNIIKLIPNNTQRQALKLIGSRVSVLWNSANFLCRQAFFSRQKVPSYSSLCSLFRDNLDYKALPSDIAQEVLKKLSKSWISYFSLLKQYKKGKIKNKPSLPGYRKNRKTGVKPFDYIPVKSNRAYSIDNGCLNMTLPADIRNGRLLIPFRGILRYQGELKTCELKYDDAIKIWYAHIVVDVPEPQRQSKPEKYATGDIGARRTIAISIQNSNISHVFSSRGLWKDYRYWSRRIAKVQSNLSNQGLKTSRRLKKLYRTRRLRLRHGLESVAAEIIGLLKKGEITHFKVGYPKDCREDMNFGKNNSLVHNFWNFSIFLDILEKHCLRRGIEFERIGESGTSEVCHICGLLIKRPIRSRVICSVHGMTHADVNASLNMLRVYAPTCGDGLKVSPAWGTYEWDKHSWLPRAKSLDYLQNLKAV